MRPERDEERGWWLDETRTLFKAQCDFWKRSLASKTEKMELMATWKFLNEDIIPWTRTAYDPIYSDGTQRILFSL
jgi:hypothetical protein